MARPHKILLFALALALCVELYHFDRVLQDDAFISFVYARNLVRGAGLVYNAGEPAVEGYSNFLWTLLVALGMRAGLEPASFARVLGMLCSAALLPLTAALARRLGASATMAAGAALLLASRRAFCLEAVGGLETLLFAALVVAALLARTRHERTQAADLGSSALLALAALTRPEGALAYGLLELCDLAAAARARALDRWLWRALLRGVPFALVLGLFLAWRHGYYGELVPNTFFAKVGGGAARLSSGLDYVFLGVVLFGPFLVALPYLSLGLWRGASGWGTCLFFGAAWMLYVASVGGDFKPTSRFLLPVLPLWSALAAAALALLGRRLEEAGHARGPSFAALVLATLGALSAAAELRLSRELNPSWTGRALRNAQLAAAGRYFDETLAPDALVAVSNAGAIPYYADRRALDMLGLNDAHIARRPVGEGVEEMVGHMKGDGGYVLSKRPDVILFLRMDVTSAPLASMPNVAQAIAQMAFGTSEREIAADPRFARAYRLRSEPLPDGGFVNFFERRERRSDD